MSKGKGKGEDNFYSRRTPGAKTPGPPSRVIHRQYSQENYLTNDEYTTFHLQTVHFGSCKLR